MALEGRRQDGVEDIFLVQIQCLPLALGPEKEKSCTNKISESEAGCQGPAYSNTTEPNESLQRGNTKSSRIRGELQKELGFYLKHNLFFCSYCKKSFKENSALREHILIHAQERPYQCNECNRLCSTASNLKQHLQTHEKINSRTKYRCDQCNRSYNYRSCLKKHMKKHENQAPIGGPVHMSNQVLNPQEDVEEFSAEARNLEPLVKKQPKVEKTLRKDQQFPKDSNPVEPQPTFADNSLLMSLLPFLMIDNLASLNGLLNMQNLNSMHYDDPAKVEMSPESNKGVERIIKKEEEGDPWLKLEAMSDNQGILFPIDALKQEITADQKFLEQYLNLFQSSCEASNFVPSFVKDERNSHSRGISSTDKDDLFYDSPSQP